MSGKWPSIHPNSKNTCATKTDCFCRLLILMFINNKFTLQPLQATAAVAYFRQKYWLAPLA